jgi:tetratricopeptide (TPR) repeat protein
MSDWLEGEKGQEPKSKPVRMTEPVAEPDLAVVFAELLGRFPGLTPDGFEEFLMGQRVSDGALAEWLGQHPGATSLEDMQELGQLGGEVERVALGLVRTQSSEPVKTKTQESSLGSGEPGSEDWTEQLPQTPEIENLDLSTILESQEWDFYCALDLQVRRDKIDQLQQLLTITEFSEHQAVIWRQVGRLWSAEGDCLASIEAKQEALASFDQAIKVKPDFHEAWNSRGISLDDLGRYEEAIASYDKAIEFKPDKHEAWYNRGISLSNLGRNEEAIASYDKAIEVKPDKHGAWNSRGISLGNLGRNEEAIASFDKAIEFKPDKHEAWYNRGVALSGLGRYEDELASYDKAIEFKPDKHEAWNNKGITLDKLGRYGSALASYDKAIDIQPDLREAWVNRGIILQKLGRQQEATASYDRAIELDPDYHRGKMTSIARVIIMTAGGAFLGGVIVQLFGGGSLQLLGVLIGAIVGAAYGRNITPRKSQT